MESYTGVRVINVTPDIINQVYKEQEISLSRLDGRIARHLSQNEYCVLKFENPPNSQSALTRVIGEDLILLPNDLYASGIKPRNKEQRMAMDALLDDNIRVVVLTGTSGAGKTLMALNVAMDKIERKQYKKIIFCKNLAPVGKELGYLPGGLLDRVLPYNQGVLSNIEFLLGDDKDVVQDAMEQFKINFIPTAVIRGSSIHNALVIVDEVQNLTSHELLTVGTRVANGSKIILLGDLKQIDAKMKKESTGIYHFVNSEEFKQSKISSYIHLLKDERGEVSKLFSSAFER